MKLLPIVEGDGDLTAVPALIRHVLATHQRFDVDLLPAQRRGEWPKVKNEFDRYFQVAILESAPIIWVLDFDCEFCLSVDNEEAWAYEQANKVKPDHPFRLCFIVKEFESLFLADEATTRSVFNDIPASRAFPADPEQIRDAKGWISSARPSGSSYKPTMHQAKLASQLNVGVLRARSESFRRFETNLLSLIAEPAKL